MGWEAPNLPEWQRWWARRDFEDLPEVPAGVSLRETTRPTLQDSRPRARDHPADTRDLGAKRPFQGHFWGSGVLSG